MLKRVASVGLLTLLSAVSALASPITIFNTGLDPLGAVLSGGSVDPHWTVDSTTAFVASESYPIVPAPGGLWIANDATSKWIAPDANVDQNFASFTTFTYRTTFDLTGFIPSTASLSGRFASDNQTMAVRLNSVDFLLSPSCADSTADVTCFTTWHPFSISSGFTSGVNTLEFQVLNGEGPSGLRVEVAGTVEPVPEPGTLLLVGSGVSALVLRRRRKA